MRVVAVRVKPGASRARAGGRHDGINGPALVLAVQERAVDGRATEAARVALASALGVPKSSVSLRSGATSKDKLFVVEDPPSDLDDRLARLMEGGSAGAARTEGHVRRQAGEA